MASFQGILADSSSFPFDGRKLWSFKLEGDRTFYRTGEVAIDANKGQFLTFEGSKDHKGNVKVNLSTLVVKDADKPQVSEGLKSFRHFAAKKEKAEGEMTSAGFWEAKTTRDIDTQKRIEIQSARNSALTFIELMFKHGEFTIPTKLKNKVEFLEGLLEHYINEFVKRNSGAIVSPPQSAASSSAESAPEVSQ